MILKNHTFDFRITMTHPVEMFLGSGGSAGSFPSGTIVQFVVEGCNPDFVNVCFTARTQRLSGSESEGLIRFGAELSQEPGVFDDFLFDVALTPTTPQDTLAVELTLDRREVLPVAAGCFNARTQGAYRCTYTGGVLSDSAAVSRADTLRVRVRVYFSPSGLPAPHASFRLVGSTTTDPTGTHQHFANRPVGTFFLLDDVELVDSASAGVRGQVRVTVAEEADTTVIYRPTGVSGVEHLFAQATLAGQTTVASDSVIVRLSDLVPLQEGGSIDLIGTDAVHPAASRYFGTVEMVDALRKLGDSIQTMADSVAALPAEQRPSGRFPDRLGVNDMSLPWGGLFDLTGTWHHPHKSHRLGRSADIDVRRGADDDQLARAVFRVWRRLGGRVVNERAAANHLHLELRP